MPTVTTLSITIAARALPAVLALHRAIRKIEGVLKDQVGDQVELVVYRGAHARALDTILWFAYGERPAPRGISCN